MELVRLFEGRPEVRGIDRELYAFNGYTLDLNRGCLRDAHGEIELRPKGFRLLCYLVQNAGRLISKDELVNAVWPNVIVGDDSLAQCMSELRNALNDRERHIIKTVPRRGYLFTAPISFPRRFDVLGPTAAEISDRADPEYSVETALRPGSAPSNQPKGAETRRLAAILAADVVGYSRLIGKDEGGTLRDLKAIRSDLIDPTIAAHNGRLVKTTGDGLLVEFSSVVDALRCATEFQQRMSERNESVSLDRRIEFRIGVHQGDVVVDDGDILGDGVNVAARLQELADPGGICVSARVQEDAAGRLHLAYEDMGQQQLKNIARTVHCLRVSAIDRPNRRTTLSYAASAARLSIVVLPFANLSNDPEQEHFADAITEDITTDLSRISDSFVIARNTAFTYKRRPVDIKLLGRELGVRYVIEGSVRPVGAEVSINVQLIDAESGAHLWADKFDVDRANLYEAQNQITGRLARSFDLQLTVAADQRIAREAATHPDAQALVLTGRAWLIRPSSLRTRQEAQRAFERALIVNPQSVDAKVYLALTLVSNSLDGWSRSPVEDRARAEELLLEALEQASNLFRAHYTMGILRRSQGILVEAQIELETAIALNRNYGDAAFQLGLVLAFRGLPEAGIAFVEKSIRLSPQDPNLAVYMAVLGACHFLLGRVNQAIDLLRRARAVNPRYWYIHYWLAGALGLKGDVDEARTVLAKAIDLKPEVSSFARYSAQHPWESDGAYLRLRANTLDAGLRRVGFPDY
jgi:adenylate cyclase